MYVDRKTTYVHMYSLWADGQPSRIVRVGAPLVIPPPPPEYSDSIRRSDAWRRPAEGKEKGRRRKRKKRRKKETSQWRVSAGGRGITVHHAEFRVRLVRSATRLAGTRQPPPPPPHTPPNYLPKYVLSYRREIRNAS